MCGCGGGGRINRPGRRLRRIRRMRRMKRLRMRALRIAKAKALMKQIAKQQESKNQSKSE